MIEFLTALPVAKFVYSVILVGLVLLLGKEFWTLWADSRLYIGRFDYFDSGEEKEADARMFALQIAHHHRTLLYLFSQEEQRRSPPEQVPAPGAEPSAGTGAEPQQENTWWPKEVVPINNATSALSEVEITVQGVNVKEILSKIRQWVSTPNEVTGTVIKSPDGVSAVATWPKGPSRTAGRRVDGQFLTVDGQPDASRAAFHIACSLIWAQAASGQENLSKVPRTEFCNWADAWASYVALRSKSTTLGGLGTADLEQLKKLREFLDRLVASSASYPEVYRLRADLVDLLPKEQKTEADLAQAQGDRTRYAVLIASKKEEARTAFASRTFKDETLEARALARPALRVRDGKLVEEDLSKSDAWKRLLQPVESHVAGTSRATGALVRRGVAQSEKHLTAFAIAPGIIMTVGWDFPPELLAGKLPAPLPPGAWEFSFDDRPDTAARPLSVTHVLFGVNHTSGSPFSFALLEVSGHNPSVNPPLVLEWTPKAVDALVDKSRYVYALGYPSEGDPRLPRAFVLPLLGGTSESHTKRLMPGELLSVQPLADTGVRRLTTDVSTTMGVSGGPLVELRSGRVVGLLYEGLWEEERKFAYAFAMPDLLALLPVELIQRLHTEPLVDDRYR